MSPTSPALLDDVAALDAGDPSGMLRAIASSGAQVREAALLTAEAGVERLVADGRPRAVVVCGMGGSGIAGDVLAAVAGSIPPGSPASSAAASSSRPDEEGVTPACAPRRRAGP